MELFKILIHYSNLGYDITLTSIVGKDGIRMVKRYSHKAERSLVCEQMSEHHKLLDKKRLQETIQFLYDDIKNQEETGIYRQTTEEYLNS